MMDESRQTPLKELTDQAIALLADGGALRIVPTKDDVFASYTFSGEVGQEIVARLRAAPVAMRERAAMAGYVACAETRHVTLGRKVADAIRAIPLDAPAPTKSDTEAGPLPGLLASQPGEASMSSAPAPAPVDPVQVFRDRDGNVVGRSWKPSTPDPVAEAARTIWNAYGPSRADAPPTLAEAMTVPEVRALVEALVAARSDLFLQIEGRHGPKAAAQYPSILKADAALARLKGDTP
jgi:hypothetical protein